MGIIVPTTTEAMETFDHSTKADDLHLKLIQQIKCPAKPEERYRRLDEAAERLASLASSANEHVYRYTMNGLVTLTKAVKQIKNGKSVEVSIEAAASSYAVLAPEKTGAEVGGRPEFVQMRPEET